MSKQTKKTVDPPQDVRSYNNPWPPRHSEVAQAERLTGTVYIEDRTGTVIDGLTRSVRKGSIVEVVELGLLAPVKGRPSKRRTLLVERVERVKERGGSFLEVSTGDQSSNGKLPKMLLRAFDFIASSGRGAARYERSGRPPKYKLDARELAIAEGIWFSRRYKNDDERLTAIEKRTGKKPGRTWVRNKFGSPHKVGDEA